MKTRDQAIFDEMFKRSLALNYRTYDFKNMDDVSYPFVEMETSERTLKANKTDIKGTVFIQLSVWGHQKKRQETSIMANNLVQEALNIRQTDAYFWSLNTQATSIRWQDDTSTTTPLKRAIVELDFRLR